MTTIDSVPGFSTAQSHAGPDRSATGDEFADHYDLYAQLGRLGELTSQLDSLQQKQLRMSNSQFLLARVALQEQISEQRLKAGEDLDTIGDQIFELADRVLEARSLEHAKLSPEEMVQVASLRDW